MGNELMEQKSLVGCIILSIITCGIYYIYWLYTIMRKIKILDDEPDISVALEMILYIFIPFYAWYWWYTRAGKLARAANEKGYDFVKNYDVLFLVFAIIALSIVNTAIVQDEFNTIARRCA